MSRYENTKSKIVNGKTYYKTTIYSEVPLRNDDIYIITQKVVVSLYLILRKYILNPIDNYKACNFFNA